MYYTETKVEYLSLKRRWIYPKSITEPVVAVWKPKNCICMMVEMDVNDKLRRMYYLICLTADNVLYRYSSKKVRLRLFLRAMLMYLPKLGLMLRVYNHRF